MKEVKLTQEQINAIFDFTRKKYVRYYDVQLELVDHIASEIEVLMGEDPNLSFDKAMYKVYKSFGIFGFAKVVEQKGSALRKFWKRRIVTFLLEYFTFPKVVMTLLLSVGFYGLFWILPLIAMDTFYWQGISWGISWGMVMVLQILYFKLRKKRKEEVKLLVVESLEGTQWMAVIWLWMPIYSIPVGQMDLGYALLNSLIFAVFSILIYGVLFVFPTWLEDEVKTYYTHLRPQSA